jgi:hypothetical protein
LQSPAAKAQIEQRLAVMKVLSEFKRQLIADIARKPYDRGDLQTRQNLALTGKLTRANDRELVFALAFGEMVVLWTDFAPTTIGKLADYYVQTFGPLDRLEAAGRRPLQLAVYCKQFGLERFVAGYAQQAIKKQPALQAELEQLIGPVPAQ